MYLFLSARDASVETEIDLTVVPVDRTDDDRVVDLVGRTNEDRVVGPTGLTGFARVNGGFAGLARGATCCPLGLPRFSFGVSLPVGRLTETESALSRAGCSS